MASISGLNISLDGPTGKTVNIEWSYSGKSVKKTDVFNSTWDSNKTVTYSVIAQISKFAYRISYSVQTASGEKWYIAEENSDFSKTSQKYAKKYRVTYTAPENVKRVKVKVWIYPASYYRGIRSKKKVKHNKKKEYKYTKKSIKFFTSSSKEKIYAFGTARPDKPSAPTTEVNGANVKATFTTEDTLAKRVQFEIYSGTKKVKNSSWLSVPWPVSTVSHIFNSLLSGTDYYVRVRASNSKSGDVVYISEWSDMSSVIKTVPGIPKNFKAEALDNDRIKLDWDDVSGISSENGYTIEYTNNRNNFDASSEVSSVSSNISEHYITGLDYGYTWYFRVKANNDNGSSAWSEIIEQVIAKIPQAPSTWTLSTNIMVGEDATLYWVHNCEDGSKMTAAKIWYSINGEVQPEIDYPASGETIPSDTTIYRYTLDVSQYSEGAVILWKIKTKGAHPSFGEYSTERQLKIYGEPSVSITSDDVLQTFPYSISLLASPQDQTPVGYSLTITSDEVIDSEDSFGNPIFIYPGQEIYSNYYITDENPLEIILEPKDISLFDGCQYSINAEVIMDSGLNATSTKQFSVDVDEIDSHPFCDIDFDYGFYIATLVPASYKDGLSTLATLSEPIEGEYGYDHITFDSDTFISRIGDEIEDYFFIYDAGSWYLNGAEVSLNDYGLNVDFSPEGDFEEPFHITITCSKETIIDPDVNLDIYRIDSDNTFVEIVKGLENNGAISVIDPHPSLNTCRYRVVSRNKYTGKMNYDDFEVEVKEPILLFQWEEKEQEIVTDYTDTSEEEGVEEYTWSGSLLELPYNIGTSESNNLDVSLIEYIGRRHPVSYYGTQVGSTVNYSAVIEKDDEETLNLIRELQYYRGDVHVRDPYGNSFWANVTLSFNANFDSMTIPVSISVKRVESDKI